MCGGLSQRVVGVSGQEQCTVHHITTNTGTCTCINAQVTTWFSSSALDSSMVYSSLAHYPPTPDQQEVK